MPTKRTRGRKRAQPEETRRTPRHRRRSTISREEALTFVRDTIQICDARRIWHWGTPPEPPKDGALLNPDALPEGAPVWSATVQLEGYWLAPGHPGDRIPPIDLLRPTFQSNNDGIEVKIESRPIDYTIHLGGRAELFFGEAWTLRFPQVPVIPEVLSPDHALVKLNSQFLRDNDPVDLALLASQTAQEIETQDPAGHH